jgi:hypothetical protein
MDPYQALAEKVVLRMFRKAGISIEEGVIDPQGDLFNPRKQMRCHKISGAKRKRNLVIVYSKWGTLGKDLISDALDLPRLQRPYILIVQWRRPSGQSPYAKDRFNVAYSPYEESGGGFVYTKPLSSIVKLPSGLQAACEKSFLRAIQRLARRLA